MSFILVAKLLANHFVGFQAACYLGKCSRGLRLRASEQMKQAVWEEIENGSEGDRTENFPAPDASSTLASRMG